MDRNFLKKELEHLRLLEKFTKRALDKAKTEGLRYDMQKQMIGIGKEISVLESSIKTKKVSKNSNLKLKNKAKKGKK